MNAEHGEQESLTGTVVRGVSLSGLGYVLAQLINLGVYIVLTRLLSPSEFGVYAAGSVLVGLALLGTDGGMVSAVIHRRDRLEEAANTALIATATGGFLFALMALAAAPLVGAIVRDSEVTDVAAVMSGTVFVQALSSIPNALLQRQFSFMRRLVIEPVDVIVFGACAITLASVGLGVWSMVIGQYAALAGDVVLGWTLVRWRPRLRLATYEMWRELIGYSRYLVISGAIFWAYEQGPTFIVGRFFGTAPLGQFRNGFRLASTPLGLLVSGAAYVLFPAFARISHDAARLAPAFLRSLRWISIAALPMGLILLPLGHSLTVLLLGDRWGPAGEVTAALGAWTGAGVIISMCGEALKATGRTKEHLRMVAVQMPVTLAAMAVLVPVSLTAAAYGLSLGAALAACYAMLLASRHMDVSVREMVAELWPPLIAAVGMALALLPVDNLLDPPAHGTVVGLLLLAGEGLGGALIFAALMRLVAPERTREAASAAMRFLNRRNAGGRDPSESAA